MKKTSKILLIIFIVLAILLGAYFVLNSNENKTDAPYTCSLTVACDAILENMDAFPGEKYELVLDPTIYKSETVGFYEGETVYDVLERELKNARIHMDVVRGTTVYVKGIKNIYEGDCGSLSGWLFLVNGEYATADAGSTILKENDAISFVYTCDGGEDIGMYTNQ